MFQEIIKTLNTLKQTKPLILNITNNVTMDFIANGLLSLGASPVMSNAPQEIEDLIGLANSVIVNLGTLDDKFINLCEHACQIANLQKKPIILDPVGAGASRYRTDISLKLLNAYDIAVIRGNASEIMALSGAAVVTNGVDSSTQSELATDSALVLSKLYDAAIVVSGKTDVIVDDKVIRQFSYGSSLMPQVTGTGCLLSAVVGAFHAVEKKRLDACTFATVFYGLCGEAAATQAQGPASFKIKFLDELSLVPDYTR